MESRGMSHVELSSVPNLALITLAAVGRAAVVVVVLCAMPKW